MKVLVIPINQAKIIVNHKGLKIHMVVSHLKPGMIAMSLLLLMIVVSPLGLIVSQARILSKLLPTPNWGHQQKL